MSPSPTQENPYVQVGDSGLFVYRVGLGTMQFGWSIDEDASIDVLDAYVEQGGNFIDTADVYSTWSARLGGPSNPGGVSEEIIGRWMKSRGNRDDMIVATKVRGAMGENFSQGRDTIHQREGLSRRWIAKACEDSLRRLDVDHIDLYQTHFVDPLVPIEETLSALTDLVRRGLVRYIGCSNYSAWRLTEALWSADVNHLEPFISVQPEYNMLDPVRGNFERELAPMCEHFGIGVLPYSPLGGGLLTGKYRRDEPLPDSVRAEENAERRFNDTNWAIIEKLVEVADNNGQTPAQVAINWQRAKSFVSAPIIGANSPEQLRDTMAGLDTPLSEDDVAALDQVSDWERSRTSDEN